MADQAKKTQQSHFVLIHGACSGAYCWYKLKSLLQSNGHRVTALDLVGSGTHPKPIQDAPTFADYTEPLLTFMASLPEDEKVILVGHSLGGMNLALAMETLPHKVSAAVFLTAYMPDTVNHPSFVMEKLVESTGDASLLDTEFCPTPNDPQNLQITIRFGPKVLSSLIYQNSPAESIELAKTLMRPSTLYVHDLSKANKFTDDRYGSVTRVYIVCDEDKAMPPHFQRWMISNNPPHGVMEIKGSDHMPMVSKPQQLCQCLSEIAIKYV